MVAKPQTIFWLIRKMVSLIKKAFCFAKIMVSGIENMVWVIQTVFTRTWTTVRAAQKIVAFA